MGKRTNTAKWMDKQKRWQVNVQKDNERRSFYSSTPGRTGQRECNAKADAWLDDGIDSARKKVSELFDEYVESLKLTTGKSNWRQVESIGNSRIKPAIGSRKISVINEQHLQSIIDRAYSDKLSKKSLMNIRVILIAFLKYCRKRKLCTLVPEDLSIPKAARFQGKSIMQPQHLQILFTKDNTTLYGKPTKDRFINAYRFQILTGLRPGELIGLRWEDIVNDTVYIRRSINQFHEETQGKNENAIRHFLLTEKAKQVLDAQRELTGNCESVFDIESHRTYENCLYRYCSTNGIPKITPYELRHTFVSITKELPEGQIRSIVGHSKNMDTFGVYGHELDGENLKTADKINRLFDDLFKETV